MGKKVVRFKTIVSRLTGLSIPIFGVSWEPPKSEIRIAQEILNFLEDRRVLYNPYELELPDQCVRSVLQIREFLVRTIGDLPRREGLPEHVRAMLAACRRFLDNHAREQLPHPFQAPLAFAAFAQGLGELRSEIGLRLGIIAVMNGLDVGPELATILPPELGRDVE